LGRAGGRTRTLYVLDEPCAGLHPTDVAHLLGVLLKLTERGNAVVAVEHHLDLVRVADHVVEIGPGPGADGGKVVYEGPPAGLRGAPGAATAPFL
jgi:excinuclease ABC subunit A